MKRIRAVARILLGLLRELGDEAAYRRHLAAHGLEPSGEAWRHFTSERFRAKFIAPRCC